MDFCGLFGRRQHIGRGIGNIKSRRDIHFIFNAIATDEHHADKWQLHAFLDGALDEFRDAAKLQSDLMV
jgi:hypothetical protein